MTNNIRVWRVTICGDGFARTDIYLAVYAHRPSVYVDLTVKLVQCSAVYNILNLLGLKHGMLVSELYEGVPPWSNW